MHPDLERLGRLSDLDQALDKARAELAAAKGAVAAATSHLRDLESARDTVDAEMRAAKEKERAAHRDIAEYQTRLKRAEQALETGIGDPAAAEKQRQQCIDIIDRLETDELVAMDAVGSIRPRLDAAAAKVSAAAASLAETTAAAPDRTAAAQAEVFRLEAERTAEIVPLSRELLSRYDLLRTKKPPAVVRITSSNTCPKCQFVVPPQARIEADNKLLPVCRGCGRWLQFV